MALSKLYYVYGLDTACLYTDEEYDIEQRIIKARCLKEKLKNKLIPHNNKPPEYTLNHNKRMQILTQYINKNKDKLKELLSENKEITRTIRPEKLTIKRKVSIFDSNLTRCFGMKERELNEEIIIIRVYFFDVAESIIKQGFYMNGNKYVFFSSSAGQIRTKKLVAVREDLLKKHWNTLSAGLSIEKINELGGINRNKYLAYLSLCNSATDVWEGFDIDRSIVVDDFETEVFGTVDYIDNKTFEITRRDMKIPITHTDGCGMICTGNKDFMVRLPWVKGLLGYFPFQDFIKEYNCSPIVTDVWGDKHNIIEENIQVIFTKSQFKLWKYYSNWNSYKENFKKYNCTAGICNEEEDEIPDATINYQMIQTLFDLSDEELLELAQDSINDIKNLTSDKDTMLRVFGAVPYNKRKNGFQKCLEIYPELLSDIYTRHTLKDIKNSLENDLWSAKLKVNGKYTFLMPDLYAFCEHLFMGIEVPEGLLKNGEVFCRLYPEGKLDCLRSPHLYIEHAVRQNILDEKKRRWFKTKAIYTSSFDIISKILQFDDH